MSTEIHYVERAANLDGNRVLIAVLVAMGIPIVFIGMIGLLNSMTMNVIERTRDVGILRCIGASSRTVRRIFRTEALTVALGAVIAIPGGWLRAPFSWVVTELFQEGLRPLHPFPPLAAVFAVAMTVALAWLVVIAPAACAPRTLEPSTHCATSDRQALTSQIPASAHGRVTQQSALVEQAAQVVPRHCAGAVVAQLYGGTSTRRSMSRPPGVVGHGRRSCGRPCDSGSGAARRP